MKNKVDILTQEDHSSILHLTCIIEWLQLSANLSVMLLETWDLHEGNLNYLRATYVIPFKYSQ